MLRPATKVPPVASVSYYLYVHNREEILLVIMRYRTRPRPVWGAGLTQRIFLVIFTERDVLLLFLLPAPALPVIFLCTARYPPGLLSV